MQSSLAEIVFLFSLVMMVSYFACHFKTRELADLRTEPLFAPKLVIEEVSPAEDDTRYWWQKVKFDGARTYYEYGLLPIYKYVIRPILRSSTFV